MADNGGTISGRVYQNGWQDGGPAGLYVSLNSLTLGGENFYYMPARPEVQTVEGGYFAVGFSGYPQHVGKIDQHLRAQVLVQNDTGVIAKGTIRVSLYVSLGQIWKGMGGPSKAKEIPDIINSWTDVYASLKKVPVPQVLKQTGWMSAEAYALLGHVNFTV